MIGLNHSFLAGVASDPSDRVVQALALIAHSQRRIGELPRVHESLAIFDTGDGPLVQWANRKRADPELAPFVTLILRMTAGPFASGEPYEGPIEPELEASGLADWLQQLVRVLLAAPTTTRGLLGLISPAPTGGVDGPMFQGGDKTLSNWLDVGELDRDLAAASEGRTAFEVLQAAEAEMGGQLVVLPSALHSAKSWTLDCRASELHRALLGLEEYVRALEEGLSREAAANRYHERTTIPMSQESGDAKRKPTRRRQRTFVVPGHGEQYFDMHAKPGTLTRVHVWTPPSTPDEPTSIYVGHCGKHLD